MGMEEDDRDRDQDLETEDTSHEVIAGALVETEMAIDMIVISMLA